MEQLSASIVGSTTKKIDKGNFFTTYVVNQNHVLPCDKID